MALAVSALGRGLIAAALALVIAAPAHATVYGVAPANSDGPDDTFATNEALWAVGTANPLDGINQLCVVDEFSTAASCSDDGVWGSPNAIATTGTFLQPIVSAPLPTGRYRILADNGDDGQDTLSVPFTVIGCTDVDCSTTIADAELQQWKAAAAQSLDGPAASCLATTILNRDAKTIVAGALTGSARQFVVAQLRDGSALGLEFNLPASTAAGAMSLLQHVSCGAWLAYSDIVSDPPDPDFEQLAPPGLRELPVTSNAEANAAGAALELLRGNAVAQRVSSERYQGAVLAGDAGWSSAQAAGVAETGFAMGQGMRRAVAPLRAFAMALDGDLAIAAATPADLQDARDVRDRVRTLGFTADERAELIAFGQTPDDIDDLRLQMGAPLPPGAGGVHPADALRQQADALEAAACHALGSSCAFDDFARLAGAVAGDTAVPPRVEVAEITLQEGDRGVNHVHVPLRLSHPPTGEVRLNVAVSGSGALPEGVSISGVGGVVFDRQRLRAVIGVSVANDDVTGPDRSVMLDVQPTGPALGPVAPVTLAIVEDDATPAPRSGVDGRLAFATEDGSIHLAERSGSDVHPVSDGAQADRRGLVDWSADGRFMLIARPSSASGPRTVDLLPVGADARPAGPAFPVTPEVGVHDGPSLSRDSRRLVVARFHGSVYQLVVQGLAADGHPEGAPVELRDDPQLTNISFSDQPSWSPDGAHIAFRGCGPAFTACGIYVLDVTASGDVTGAPHPLLIEPAGSDFTYPSWSPDGRFVAYSVYRPYAMTQFAVERIPVTAAGTAAGPSAVLAARHSELPARWARDSRAVALTLVEHPMSDAAMRSRVVVELDEQARAAREPTLIAPLSTAPLHIVWGPPVAEVQAPVAPTPAEDAAGGPSAVRPARPGPVVRKPVAAATLPSNRRCVSRRLFRVKLSRPPGDPLLRAEVRIGPRRVRSLRGSTLVAPVNLRGLPKGRFTVTVTAVTRAGRKLTTRRTYRTCVTKSRSAR